MQSKIRLDCLITRILDSLVLPPLGSMQETFMHYKCGQKPKCRKSKQKFDQQRCSWRSRDNLSGCLLFNFAPLAAFDVIVKLVTTTKKCENKIKRANFARTECQKNLTQGSSNAEVSILTRKISWKSF